MGAEGAIMLNAAVEVGFWETGDFWLFLVLSLMGITLSAIGAWQAYSAKLEAKKAGQTVRIQTITIELSEMCQRLEKLDGKIDYQTARDIHSEVNRKLRRLIAQMDVDTISAVQRTKVDGNLVELKEALNAVRPVGDAPVIPGAVYFAVENHFTSLIGTLSEMIGELEGSPTKR